jgi:serine phosphatase RsbU (regulator of sigma subunit)
MSGLNDTMVRSAIDRFCTAVYATVRLSGEAVEVRLVRGGHPLPMVVRAGGEVEEVHTSGGLVGFFTRQAFEEGAISLQPGDAIVIFTDGLIDKTDGTASLRELLSGAAGMSAEEITKRLEVAAIAGREALHDDVVAVTIRVSE